MIGQPNAVVLDDSADGARIGPLDIRGPAMTFSLYDATIPVFAQGLGSMAGLLDKAEAFCAETGAAPEEIIQAQLIADMFPFAYQIKSTVVHSVGAIEGVRAGTFSPDRSTPPEDFAALRGMVANAREALAKISPADINGLIGQDMKFVAGKFERLFTAENFLMSFSLPNFFFHATTAYDLMRTKGVGIGKLDFLGALRIKQ
jgi:uncharacterized protein